MSQPWHADVSKWNRQFVEWLTQIPSNSDEQLIRWCRGLDTPAVANDLPPYLVLLRALPKGSERIAPVKKLASLVSVALRAAPLTDAELLFNLLQTAAGLAQPDLLAEALHTLHQADLRHLRHHGLSVSTAQRNALQWNQQDDRWFETVWLPMLSGKGVISGQPLDAIAGIQAMPDEDNNQESSLHLGEALRSVEPAPNAPHAELESYEHFLADCLAAHLISADSLALSMLRADCRVESIDLALSVAPQVWMLPEQENTPEQRKSIARCVHYAMGGKREGLSIKFFRGVADTLLYHGKQTLARKTP